MQKQVDRAGKKYANYVNTNEIQNQLSLRAKTWYRHPCKNQRYQSYVINLAFVGAVKTTKNLIYTRWLRPEVLPITILYTIFGRKDTPFVYLPLTNGP